MLSLLDLRIKEFHIFQHFQFVLRLLGFLCLFTINNNLQLLICKFLVELFVNLSELSLFLNLKVEILPEILLFVLVIQLFDSVFLLHFNLSLFEVFSNFIRGILCLISFDRRAWNGVWCWEFLFSSFMFLLTFIFLLF